MKTYHRTSPLCASFSVLSWKVFDIMDKNTTTFRCFYRVDETSYLCSRHHFQKRTEQKNKRKNGDFAALRRLSPDGEELDGGGARVRDFILRSAQQEEALHRIWYSLRRWRLLSRRIVLFPTTACSSINWR
ncbi:unnamed protein product [Spirodela intermedia]|uniref:Uncharacterized protein n=1 Tax=Spirodela intermedia TaxID=51605 RepID=A0A7I8LDF3_SPIIN|nr:unnamed protein product [Spirodela intermedia]